MKIDPSLAAIAPREPAPRQVDAHDFRQFAALRRGADGNDPKVLREVARQFESLFTKMMLESMRSASFGDPLFGSDQSDMYRDMMDDQLAVQMSQGRGLGLADMLIRQLSQAVPGVQNEGVQNGGVSDAQKQKFLDDILPHARAAARELGVDVKGIVAQAALETGWGTSHPADGSGSSHNFFGIKAGASWRGASVSAETTEYVAGVAGREEARFRAYGSASESVSDYVRLLRDNPRYSAALGTGGDVRAFAEGLVRGGYATDPRYADKLVAVAEQVDRFNARPNPAAGVSPFKSAGDAPLPVSRMNNG